jgi:2TM domain
MPDERKYSDGEMREILERALQQAPDASGLTHADLLAIGKQVGVAPETMARAAAQVSEAKLDASAAQALKSRRQKWLAAHAAVFAVVNGLLFTVNYLTTPGEWWVLFSLFFWGLALAAHAGVSFAVGVSPRALERERRKLAAGPAQANPKLRIDAPAVAEPGPESSPSEEIDRAPARVASRP